jgi:pimeloyl-ACP methyl ester carboxylesterase
MMKRIELTNGLTIGYEERGPQPMHEQTPTVVLLHGFCGSREYWADVLPSLSQQVRVIAPDLRGHGSSDAPEPPYTIEQMAADVSLLADALGIGPFWLLGHSLGGYITLAFAEAYPERLKGFGLIHSTAYPDDEQGKQNRAAAAEKIQTHGVRTFVDGLVPRLFAPDNEGRMPDKVERAKQIGYGTSAAGAVGATLAMRERPDRRAVLRDSELPILLVAGEHDRIVPAARTFAVDRPNVTRVTLEQAGHMGMMEAPAALSAAIIRWMQNG